MKMIFEDTEFYNFTFSLREKAIELYHKNDIPDDNLYYSIKARKSSLCKGKNTYERYTIGEAIPLPGWRGSVFLILKTQDLFYVYTVARNASAYSLVECAKLGFEYIEEVILLKPETDNPDMMQQDRLADS